MKHMLLIEVEVNTEGFCDGCKFLCGAKSDNFECVIFGALRGKARPIRSKKCKECEL